MGGMGSAVAKPLADGSTTPMGGGLLTARPPSEASSTRSRSTRSEPTVSTFGSLLGLSSCLALVGGQFLI